MKKLFSEIKNEYNRLNNYNILTTLKKSTNSRVSIDLHKVEGEKYILPKKVKVNKYYYYEKYMFHEGILRVVYIRKNIEEKKMDIFLS